MTVQLLLGVGFEARLQSLARIGLSSSSASIPVGWLVGSYGPSDDTEVALISTLRLLESGDCGPVWLSSEARDSWSFLPGGLTLIGAAFPAEASSLGDEPLASAISTALTTSGTEAGVKQIIVVLCFLSPEAPTFRAFKGGSAVPIVVQPAKSPSKDPSTQACQPPRLDPWLSDNLVSIRCPCDVTLQVVGARPVGDSKALFPMEQALEYGFRDLTERACGCDAASRCLVACSSSGPCFLGDEEVLALATLGASANQPLPLRLVRSPRAPADGSCPAPSCAYRPLKGGPASLDVVPLHMDLLCYVPQGPITGRHLAGLVRQGLMSQLEAMQRLLAAEGTPAPLQALHFQPPGLPHPVTVLYPLPPDAPVGTEDVPALVALRQKLHRRLGLPEDRPLLRAGLALTFDGGAAPGKGGRLADVHVGLPASGVPGGRVHLIDGSYDYFHYMQDKMDDNGWGCAYRSLQTICSWFRRQHYTAAPVPSHKEIQQTLVKIGDKDASFVGSCNWIGAIELGFVLDSLLDVTSKVITVSAGADMPSKAREIAHHFDTQGTPIMIGGGVLAYTLLGISLNDLTGECAFLILDPHYTGVDDLGQVHKGQWVAWKRADGKAAAGGELFVRDAFYNLLCPQRPKKV